MRRDLLIAAGPGEWRAAWFEGGVVAELHVERGDRVPAGGIVLGRVLGTLPGLDAAFVDIGEAAPGFLPGRPPPQEGARVIVAVQRESQRGKGARLSTKIATERVASVAELAANLNPPVRLAPPLGFAAALALRLPGVPDRVLCDEAGPLAELRRTFPAAEISHQEIGGWPADVGTLFAAALSPTVALAGGGAVHFGEAEAATLVDVDTGSPETGSLARNAMAINLAAASAIARHIRLRQTGGGIVVDFAAVEGRGARERVRLALLAALVDDPARPEVLGWTRLGHLEIVRPRRTRSLSDVLLEPGTPNKTADTLAFEALRRLTREARANPAANWRFVVSAELAAALAGGSLAAALHVLEARLGRKIAIETRPAHPDRAFDIVPM